MDFNNFCSIESQSIERNECYNRKLLEKKELPKINEILEKKEILEINELLENKIKILKKELLEQIELPKYENEWSVSSINLTNNFFVNNALINNNLSIETQNDNIQYSGTLSPLATSITISPININNSNTNITNQYINNMSNDLTSAFDLSNTEHYYSNLDTILSEFNNTEIVPGNNSEYINEIYNTFNIQNHT